MEADKTPDDDAQAVADLKRTLLVKARAAESTGRRISPCIRTDLIEPATTIKDLRAAEKRLDQAMSAVAAKK